jgi:hypothetical protein
MSKKRARTLTGTERIEFEEEEQHHKAAQSIAMKRLASLSDEATATQNKRRELIDQITSIDSQLQKERERHTRQRAQQYEHQKALSKTRETYMKIVTESMVYGSLSQLEGFKLICDETVKEILALDDIHHPQLDHRADGIRHTCLDIETVLPMTSNDDSSDQVFNSFVASNLQTHDNSGTSHQNNLESSSQELNLIPDLVVVDNENTDGNVLTAWWHESSGGIKLPMHTAGTISIHAFLHAVGVRMSNNRLLLENASSETEPVTSNVARYVNGYLLALHAGVMTGSLDLQYLIGALEDLSFPTGTISRVRNNFITASSRVADSTAGYCRSSFMLQTELQAATLSIEDEVDASCLLGQEIEYRILENTAATWVQLEKQLDKSMSRKQRYTETLRILIPVGRTILAVLAGTSSARSKIEFSKLTELYHRVNQSLFSMLRTTYEDTFIQMLLTPLFAANVAFACSLRLYQEAYSCLEVLMNYHTHEKAARGVNLFVVSSLLWSQYFQLRICLPPIDLDESSLASYRSTVDVTVTELGIKLGHLKPVVGRII